MIRMLIVDDHEMVREGLKAILVSEPDFCIVGDAANAEQALELIERLKPRRRAGGYPPARHERH